MFLLEVVFCQEA